MAHSSLPPSISQVLTPAKYVGLDSPQRREHDSRIIEKLNDDIRLWNVYPRGEISLLGPALTEFAKNFCQSTSWEHLKGFVHKSDEMDNLRYMATLCVGDIIEKLGLQLTPQDDIDLVQLLQTKGIAPKTTIKNLGLRQLAAEVLSSLLKKNPLLSSHQLFKLDAIEARSPNSDASEDSHALGYLHGYVTFEHAGTGPAYFNDIRVPFSGMIDYPGYSGMYEKGYKEGATLLTNVYKALPNDMKRRLQDQSSDNKKVYEALFNQETGLLKAFQSDEESNVFSLSGPSVLAHSPSSSGPEISSEHKIEGGDVEIKTPVKISLKEHLELNSLSLRRGPASQVAGILQAAISAGVDFVGADLSGLDLSGLDLSGLDLSRAHLEGTNLSGAILKGTILKDANLSEANLSGANLSGANLSQTILSYANLRDANLTNANLSYANLLIADLTNADLTNADLTNADLTNADLTDADLTDTVVFNIITKYAILPPKYRDMMLKASRLYWPRSR